MNHSSPVSVSLEVEPELEDVIVELAPEAPLVPVLPLPVDDLEGDVLVGRPGRHPQDAVLPLLHRQQLEHGGRTLVDQVGVEDVELVALEQIKKFTFRYTIYTVICVLPLSFDLTNFPVEEQRCICAYFVAALWKQKKSTKNM